MSPACGRRSRVSFLTMFSEVWGRAAISRRERPVARHRSTVGSAVPGSTTRWPASSVRSRDAAVLLESGPRSRVSRPGVGKLRGSHPPSDRASPGNGSRPARARKRIAGRSRRLVPESLRMASSVALGDPFHVTLDISLESVQPGQLEGAAGQQGGQRASEEASGSEGGVQVGRR